MEPDQKAARGLKRKHTEDDSQGSSSTSNIKILAPVLLLLRDSAPPDGNDEDEGPGVGAGDYTGAKSITAHKSNGSVFSMVCLRVCTLLLQYAPDAVRPYKKEIIKFAWTRMKHTDVSIRAWAYLCCALYSNHRSYPSCNSPNICSTPQVSPARDSPFGKASA